MTEVKKLEMPTRVRILEAGVELTIGDRQATYGEARDNMRHFARMLNALLFHKLNGEEITSEEAAQIMVVAKISRTQCGQGYHEDNYIDAATYSAIAGECREEQES